jgi:serralysin
MYSGEIDTLSNIENAEGSDFDDFLIGNDAKNVLSGGDGNDEIAGGGGADILEGGEGMDVFIYNSPLDSGLGGLLRDVILDFDAVGTDKIDISAFNQGMFTFVGDDTNDFAGFGDSSARFNNETKILEIDADGDAQADMEIELQNVDGGDLSTSDFEVGGGQVA